MMSALVNNGPRRLPPLQKRTPLAQKERPLVSSGADISFLDGPSFSGPTIETPISRFTKDRLEPWKESSAIFPEENSDVDLSLINFSEPNLVTLPPVSNPSSTGLKEQDRALDASQKEIFALKLKIYHLEEQLRRDPERPRIEQIETQLKQSEGNLKALTMELNRIQGERDSLQAEVLRLDASLAQVTQSHRLEQNRREASETVASEAVLQHRRELEHQRFIMQAELEDAAARAAAAEAQLRQLQEKKDTDLEKAHRELQAANAQLQADIKILEEERQQVHLKKLQLEEQMACLEVNRRQLEADIQKLHREANEVEAEKKNLLYQKTLLDSNQESEKEFIESHRQQLEQERKQLETLKNEITQERAQRKAEMDQLERMREKLSVERQELQEHHQRESGVREHFVEEILTKEFQQKEAQMLARVTILERNLEDAQQQLQNRSEALQGEACRLSRENSELRSQLQRSQAQVESLQDELQTTLIQFRNMEMQLKNYELSSSSSDATSQRALSRAQETQATMQAELIAAHQELSVVQMELQASKEALQRITSKPNAELAEATKALGDAARSFAQSERERIFAQNEVKRLTTELENLRSEATKFLTSYSKERAEEAANIALLTTERDSLRHQLENAAGNERHSLGALQTELAALRRFKAESEIERAKIEAGFSAQLTKAMEKLRDCELELLRERGAIERSERTMAIEREKFAAEIRALRTAMAGEATNSNNTGVVAIKELASSDTIVDSIINQLAKRMGKLSHDEGERPKIDYLQELLRVARQENIDLLERLRGSDLRHVDEIISVHRERATLIAAKDQLQAQLDAVMKRSSEDPSLSAKLFEAEENVKQLTAKVAAQNRTIQRREALIRKAIIRIQSVQAKREAMAKQLSLLKGTKGAQERSFITAAHKALTRPL